MGSTMQPRAINQMEAKFQVFRLQVPNRKGREQKQRSKLIYLNYSKKFQNYSWFCDPFSLHQQRSIVRKTSFYYIFKINIVRSSPKLTIPREYTKKVGNSSRVSSTLLGR